MEFDAGTVALVATLLLTLASAFFGAKYRKAKGKATGLRDLLDSVIEAAEDDKVSTKEFEKIVASAKKLLNVSEG